METTTATSVCATRSSDRWFRPLLVLAILLAAAVLGARPILSYRALELGASIHEVGVIAAAFASLAILAVVPLGRWIDRAGVRPALVGGSVVMAAASALVPVAPTVPTLVIVSATLGLGQVAVVAAAHALLVLGSAPEDRDARVSIYATAISAGSVLGPFAWGAMSGIGPTGVHLWPVAAGFIATAFVLQRRLGAGLVLRPATTEPAASLLATLRIARLRRAVILSAIVLSSIDLIVAYLPVYASERGIRPIAVSAALTALALAQVLTRLVLPRSVRRWGRERTLRFGLAIAAASLPCLLLPIEEAPIVVVLLIVGAGLGVGVPITVMLVAAAIPPTGLGMAMALRMGGTKIGQLSVPLAVVALLGGLGSAGIFLATAGLLALGAVASRPAVNTT